MRRTLLLAPQMDDFLSIGVVSRGMNETIQSKNKRLGPKRYYSSARRRKRRPTQRKRERERERENERQKKKRKAVVVSVAAHHDDTNTQTNTQKRDVLLYY